MEYVHLNRLNRSYRGTYRDMNTFKIKTSVKTLSILPQFPSVNAALDACAHPDGHMKDEPNIQNHIFSMSSCACSPSGAAVMGWLCDVPGGVGLWAEIKRRPRKEVSAEQCGRAQRREHHSA